MLTHEKGIVSRLEDCLENRSEEKLGTMGSRCRDNRLAFPGREPIGWSVTIDWCRCLLVSAVNERLGAFDDFEVSRHCE